jgi:hypothetical protein
VTVQLKIRDLSAARQQGEIDALTPKKRGPKVVVSLLVKENRELQAANTRLTKKLKNPS